MSRRLGQPAPARPGPTPAARPRARRSCSPTTGSFSTFARVAGCAYISPSIAGATTTGADDARQVAVIDVVRETSGHRREPAGSGRRDEDQVGRIGSDDVRDALVGQELERVGHRPAPRQRLQGQRTDERLRGVGHQRLDVGARGDQRARQLGRLVGGDRAGHAEQDQPAVESARSPIRRLPAHAWAT